MTALLRILACGAIDRGDDGAAIRAVRALPPSALRWAQVEEVGLLSADLFMDDAPETRRVVVDCVAGLPLGEVVDLRLGDLPELEYRTGATSSHGLSPGAAVGMAALVGAIRDDDRFMGIGGERFDLGAPMSLLVVEGLKRLVERLVERIEEAGPCA